MLSESNQRELIRRNESEDYVHKYQQIELDRNNIQIQRELEFSNMSTKIKLVSNLRNN